MENLAAAIFAGVWALVGALHLRRIVRHRNERGRARAKIREVTRIADVRAEGTIARVTGVVECSELLVAPLTRKPCVAYRSRADGRRAPLERPVLKKAVCAFTVDGVRIEADTAEIALAPEELVPSVTQRDRYDEFLATLHLDRHSPRFTGGAAFDEVLVPPGARVTVIGIVALEPDDPAAQGGYRDRAHRWRLVGNKTHPIVIGEPVD